jgi:hypothetical protein
MKTVRSQHGGIYSLILPQHRVCLLRYVGDMGARAIATQLRDVFHAHPEVLFFSSVNDLRSFAGSIGYEDMIILETMVRSLRPEQGEGKCVLLSNDEAVAYMVRLAQDIFDWRGIEACTNAPNAYAAATGSAEMPAEARMFLRTTTTGREAHHDRAAVIRS